MMTQHEAIERLSAYGSHAAFDKTTAAPILEPFDILPEALMTCYTANTDPKGYQHPDLAPGTEVYVCGGWQMAEAIGRKIGAEWVGDFIGRGGRFDAAIEGIQKKLNTVQS